MTEPTRRRRLLDRLRVDEAGMTLPEMLTVIVISSIILGAIASAMLVGISTSTSAERRLAESHDAQMASSFFVSDVASARYFSTASLPVGSTCPVSGIPVALFEWTDSLVKKNALYLKDGSALVRRYCENDAQQGTDFGLIDNLDPSTPPTAVCTSSPASCGITPANVELTVQEASSYRYTLRGSPRTTGAAGGAMGGIAVYVGSGGFTLGGNSTLDVPAGVVVTGSATDCNGTNSEVDAPDGFYGNDGGDCSPTPGSPPSDPLADLPEPSPAPPNAPAPASSSLCGSPMTTYQPGRYFVPPPPGNKGPKLEDGCLAPGVYYLDDADGALLKNVQAAPGGVLIYVKQGDLDLEEVTLGPATSGDWAGVTVFMARSNAGVIKANNPTTVEGVVYAPAGELHLQSDNAELIIGAINVNKLLIQGNGIATVG